VRPKPAVPAMPAQPDILPESEARFREQLRDELLGLSFHGYEQCVRSLLRSMGYAQVRTVGRTHLRGRTLHGGLDMTALSQTGVTRSRIALQVKQYGRPVSRRFVDELRGACLRVGAEQGLLVSTSAFSRAARKAAADEGPAPVRLVDGEELLDLLIGHGVGVLAGDAGQPAVDELFFMILRRRCPESGRKPPASRGPDRDGAAPTVPVLNLYANAPGGAPSRPGRRGGGMLWRTHMLFGIGSLWLLDMVPGTLTPDNAAPLAALAAFGSLLPDLDAAESKIKWVSVGGIRPFAPLSALLYRTLGHRSLLHSLAGLALAGGLALPLAFWWGWEPWAALLLGYASHLAADAGTRHGIPLLFPRRRRYFLLPQRLRFVTGSDAEDALLVLLAAADLLLLLSKLPLQ